MRLFSGSLALLLVVMLGIGCNTVSADECWVNTSGGFGGSGTIPIGAGVWLDIFGPYLSGSLGIAVDCAGTWITGSAAPVWSGVSVRCSAGPILRFTSHP